jgi:2-hydroxy-3-oxopropionate reductase
MSQTASGGRVGFIGLGVMGRPMALNLLAAGFDVTVHSRSAERASPVIQQGAEWADSPRSVATTTDTVITMLPDSPDVMAVCQGSDGLFAGAHSGLVWIDMSTIGPITARQLAADASKLGVRTLDAPVSGGERGAIDASLSIMVGGDARTVEDVLPVLERLGRTITHVGDAGAGQVAKACNQLVVGVTISAVAEALVLARKAGVDPGRVRTALLGGFAQSRVLEVHGQRMLDRAFEAGFRTALHQKDLSIVTETARGLAASTPLAAAVAQLMNALSAAGGGGNDHSAIVQVYERLAACTVPDTGVD